jgi:short-subunit dehydrogenase
MKIENRVVWITGASSGIGEALAFEFFRQGADVILSARNVSKLNGIKDRIDAMAAGRCHVIPCDVTDTSSVQQAVLLVKKVYGRLDILVNNAGMSQRAYALDTSIEVDRALFEVNFFGAVSVSKSILPFMIAGGGGHIVVVSSMAGKYGFRMRTAYAASKHALHGFFETLRAELHDKNVGVTMICPGRVQTDISINSITGNGQKYGKMDAGQAHGVPVEKCARLIVKAVRCNRKEVFIGRPETFLLVVKRVCPALYYFIVNRVSPT